MCLVYRQAPALLYVFVLYSRLPNLSVDFLSWEKMILHSRTTYEIFWSNQKSFQLRWSIYSWVSSHHLSCGGCIWRRFYSWTIKFEFCISVLFFYIHRRRLHSVGETYFLLHPCLIDLWYWMSGLFRTIKIFMLRKQQPRERESDNACYQFPGSLHPTKYRMKCWIHKCWQIFQPRLVWILFLTKD